MLAFGLDISDRSIEVLQFNKRKKVKAFARVLLEKGIIEEGVIVDKEKLALKIRQTVKKAKAKGKKVVFSLPESQTFVHFFKDRQGILEQAKKVIPIDLNEVYFNIKGNLYIACPKKIVNSYEEALKKAGLEPLAAEIEPVSLARSLQAEDCLIVDIGAKTTSLSIFDKNENLRLIVSLKRGGNHFTGALAKKLSISLKEAKEFKEKIGLDQNKKNGRVLLVLQKELQPILKEVKKAIGFYEQDIKCIILAGGSARMPKLADYFFSNLNINAVVAESLMAKQLKDESALFNVAAGLALRESNLKSFKINLLPKREKKSNFKKPLFYISFLFFILGIISLIWALYKFILIPFSHIPGFNFIVPKKIERQTNINQEEQEEITIVTIGDTPTGWLRVREGPGLEFAAIDKVFSGESFPLLEQQGNWCKIKIKGRIDGWVSAKYIIINNN